MIAGLALISYWTMGLLVSFVVSRYGNILVSYHTSLAVILLWPVFLVIQIIFWIKRESKDNLIIPPEF